MEITKEKLLKAGYVLDRTYTHDQFKTHQYKKGSLVVEMTYEGKKLVNIGVTPIEELIDVSMTWLELEMLERVVNRKAQSYLDVCKEFADTMLNKKHDGDKA